VKFWISFLRTNDMLVNEILLLKYFLFIFNLELQSWNFLFHSVWFFLFYRKLNSIVNICYYFNSFRNLSDTLNLITLNLIDEYN